MSTFDFEGRNLTIKTKALFFTALFASMCLQGCESSVAGGDAIRPEVSKLELPENVQYLGAFCRGKIPEDIRAGLMRGSSVLHLAKETYAVGKVSWPTGGIVQVGTSDGGVNLLFGFTSRNGGKICSHVVKFVNPSSSLVYAASYPESGFQDMFSPDKLEVLEDAKAFCRNLPRKERTPDIFPGGQNVRDSNGVSTRLDYSIKNNCEQGVENTMKFVDVNDGLRTLRVGVIWDVLFFEVLED